ncbi:MAG: hypothetical protein ACLPIC_01500 [Rhodoblastus sp.]
MPNEIGDNHGQRSIDDPKKLNEPPFRQKDKQTAQKLPIPQQSQWIFEGTNMIEKAVRDLLSPSPEPTLAN